MLINSTLTCPKCGQLMPAGQAMIEHSTGRNVLYCPKCRGE